MMKLRKIAVEIVVEDWQLENHFWECRERFHPIGVEESIADKIQKCLDQECKMDTAAVNVKIGDYWEK